MSDLIQAAQAAYANNNLEACRKLIPRFVGREKALVEYIERLERELVALRLELNKPREATVTGGGP